MAGPGRRRSIPRNERFKVWLAAGGRCTICKRDLLEGRLTSLDLSLGELAHIVGHGTGERSPRGENELPEADRDLASNLMLVCANEHDEIDRDGAVDLLRVDELRRLKHDHEDSIRRLTGLATERGTVVLRMIGTVYGRAVDLSKPAATEAVVRSELRFPDYALSEGRYGIEIDLRELPGEAESSEQYWLGAMSKIDEITAHKLSEAVRAEHVPHLSVFGFARLPLLVYLGARLDDTYPVTVYQRHRNGETWTWPPPGEPSEPVLFATSIPDLRDSPEAVLVLNVSGTVAEVGVPAAVANLPRIVIAPDAMHAEADTIRSLADLASFELALRRLWAALEVSAQGVRRLHVIAALPVSAAVVLGRTHHAGVDPTMVVYFRAASGYLPALEIA